MIFDGNDYNHMRRLFRVTGYPGYRPAVVELPNGDGKADTGKRYLHIALKYDPPKWALRYLAMAHLEACRVAEAIGVPDAFYPKVENGTLRVLEYPAGAGSAEHTDFDLFTVHCYRDRPEDFVRLDPVDPRAERVSQDVHIGELGEIVGLGRATRHYVPERPYRQKAIVYFAMPAMDARLTGAPPGWTMPTVKQWLNDRLDRSRMYT
jgi:hypothetical protein